MTSAPSVPLLDNHISYGMPEEQEAAAAAANHQENSVLGFIAAVNATAAAAAGSSEAANGTSGLNSEAMQPGSLPGIVATHHPRTYDTGYNSR